MKARTVAAIGIVCAMGVNAFADPAPRTPATKAVRIRLGDEEEERLFPPFARYANGLGHILAGETIVLTADEVDGKLVRVRAVDKSRGKSRTIVLKLEQARDGRFADQMLLTVWNHFDRPLRYRAILNPSGVAGDLKPTDTCAVMPEHAVQSIESPLWFAAR